ncbi:MAG: 50S ribosomal protein L17 [Chitinophagaceae bacterium]
MRHGDKINNLGRKKAHRDALLSNLASQLIVHKRIVTTIAKAKALRTYIEPLITKTKKTENQTQIMHQHRIVFSYLEDKQAVKELFTVVAPKIASRPGGYTRILKLGIRPGDNAEKAMIELVDFNDVYGKTAAKAAEPARRTRRGRSGAAKKTDEKEPIANANEKTENTAAEPEKEMPSTTEGSNIPPVLSEQKTEE